MTSCSPICVLSRRSVGRRRGLGWAALAVVSVVTAVGGSASGQIVMSREMFAITGQEAPETEEGTQLFYFESPVLDAAGKVAFSSQVVGPNASDTQGIVTYYGTPGKWQTLRIGSPDPVDPTVTLDAGDRPTVSPGGQFAVVGTLQGPGVDVLTESVIYSGPLNQLTRLGRGGTPAPGADEGTNLDLFFQGSQRVNDSGNVVFQAGLFGPNVSFENNQGLYFAKPGQAIELINRQGDVAAGFDDPNARYFFSEVPVLSPTNQIAFTSLVEVPNPVTDGTSIAFAVYSRDAGATASDPLRVVAKTRDPAPGYSDPTATFELVNQPLVNRSGITVYSGYVTGDNVAFEDAFGLYADRPGQATDDLLVRTNTPAPKLPAGTLLSGLSEATLNANGRLVFGVELAGEGVDITNDTALYSYNTNPGVVDPWTLIIREGDAAPGIPYFFGQQTFSTPGVNGNDQVAIYCGLFADPADPFNTVASLWLWDPIQGLALVALQGEFVEVAPGDFRQISSLTLDSFRLGSGLEDGRRSSFNDAGQLVYAVSLFNGDPESIDEVGLFLSTPTVVPEPSVFLALLPTLALSSGRRRR